MKAVSLYERELPRRVSLDGQKLQQGLARLVLSLVEVLRDLLERQALRRVESGTLSSEQVERLGLAFMQLKKRMMEVGEALGLRPEELNLFIGSKEEQTGLRPQTSLVDLIDKVIDRGAVVGGEIVVSVADVDLITLDLLLMLSSVHRLEAASRKGGA